VVFGCHRKVGAAHRAAIDAQTIEGLRTRYFMNEVKIDVQQVGFAG
jgi:hypothetical protein